MLTKLKYQHRPLDKYEETGTLKVPTYIFRKCLIAFIFSIFFLTPFAASGFDETPKWILKSGRVESTVDISSLLKEAILTMRSSRFTSSKTDGDLEGEVQSAIKLAEIILATSQVVAVDNDRDFAILFSWPSDLFVYVGFGPDGRPLRLGLAVGDTMSSALYKKNYDGNIIKTQLYDRKNLVVALQRDIPKEEMSVILDIFGRFVSNADQNRLANDTLDGFVKLSAFALKNSCRLAAENYIQTKRDELWASFGDNSQASDFYLSVALPVKDGVAYAAADEATNKHKAYLIFSVAPDGMCPMRKAYTSIF